jgi:hypothetical protein
MVKPALSLLAAAVLAVLLSGPAAADDRERRARAALALADALTPAAAPAPRPAAPPPAARSYADGYAEAQLRAKPLVVFVGCEVQKCEGAICSRVDADRFGEVKAPAVVVGYPAGSGLLMEAALPCPASPAEIEKAVGHAARKMAAPTPPKAMPAAPKPLDWKVSAPAAPAGGDGLDEVNAKRAAAGLRPFVRDDGLTTAAKGCAEFRAAYQLFGHTSNDFAFVPAGVSCSAAGCAAYPASYGWMSCCTYDRYDRAGAYWAAGADGKRYMHLFVGRGGAAAPPAAPPPAVAPGWEWSPAIQPYYAGGVYCLPGRA